MRSTGDPKNQNWIRQEVKIDSTTVFRVGFEATVGANDKTDISLDDISFSAGCYNGGTPPPPTGSAKCKTTEYHCAADDLCINKHWVCDGSKDCTDGAEEVGCIKPSVTPTPSFGPIHPGDCDFTNSMCLWKPAYFADMDWHRLRGRTPSYKTGPSEDHTTGTGELILLYDGAYTRLS